ncbi:MAG: TetR/AcrR family transcriptional regulator [Deinococcus sp.]|nr:TetR/AcrR family transcriptional regulator [Deinococcus sp.]
MLPREERLDPRKKRTRQLLQQAFMALLAEKGFPSITVRDIAERATVNRATFYAHFADKNALVDYCIREPFQQMLREKLPADAKLSAENLQRLILVVCEFLAQLHDHCVVPSHDQFAPLVERQIKAQLYEVLLTWLKGTKSYGPTGYTVPELAATVASWAICGAAWQWSQGDRAGSAQELARQVLPMINASLNAQASW